MDYSVYIATWNLMTLQADSSLCEPTEAWKKMDHATRVLVITCKSFETALEDAEVHSSQMWFAWGLLDLHVKNLRKSLSSATSIVGTDVDAARSEIEHDVRHVLNCVQSEPLEHLINSRIINLCFDHFYTNLQLLGQATRTILYHEIPRFKLSKSSILHRK